MHLWATVQRNSNTSKYSSYSSPTWIWGAVGIWKHKSAETDYLWKQWCCSPYDAQWCSTPQSYLRESFVRRCSCHHHLHWPHKGWSAYIQSSSLPQCALGKDSCHGRQQVLLATWPEASSPKHSWRVCRRFGWLLYHSRWWASHYLPGAHEWKQTLCLPQQSQSHERSRSHWSEIHWTGQWPSS